MPGIFLAGSQFVPPPPSVPVAAFPGLAAMTWTGWDGTVFDLLDPAAGVFLAGGVLGLNMPTHAAVTRSTPGVAGSRLLDTRALGRDITWPVFMFSATSQGWVDLDRAFWATMHPDRAGVWSVTDPAGSTRKLRARYVDDGGHIFTADPTSTGWQLYVVRLVADQPYWEGEPVTRSWKGGPAEPYYGGTGGGGYGPPYFIAPGSTLGTATMDNPGDVDAYPVWTITGPTTSVTVGVGGRLVTAPFPIPDGTSLTVDPRPGPTGKSAYDSTGARRTAELSDRDFAPIAHGASVPLSLAMTGDGMVTATLTPLYRRYL